MYFSQSLDTLCSSNPSSPLHSPRSESTVDCGSHGTTVTIGGSSTTNTNRSSLLSNGSRPKRKGHSPKDSGGDVVVCTPWLPEGCRKYDISLSDEIRIFSKFVSISERERSVRNMVIQDLEKWLSTVFPTAVTNLYGSFAYGTCTPASALDLSCEHCVNICATLPRSVATLSQEYKVLNMVCQGSEGFLQVENVRENVKVNMVFSEVENTRVKKFTEKIHSWLKEFPNAVPVHSVLRHVLSQVRCGDVRTGGLSSCALLVMIIRICRVCDATDPAEILHSFLLDYGCEFSFEKHAVCGSKRSACLKHSADPIVIIDPTDQTNNLSENSTSQMLLQVRSQFLYCQMGLQKWSPSQAGRKGYKGRTPLSSIISHQSLWVRVDALKAAAQQPQPTFDTTTNDHGIIGEPEELIRTDELGSLVASLYKDGIEQPSWVWDIASDIHNANLREKALAEQEPEEGISL
eukprot:TRINITY_DN2196_c1_g1_i1.p1 TRINITY_DN2196_c1_g1~~TRINITY_DN2196_c1_g1_i1.p1  ORF type:complete len:485 (+),score=71.97 TRINITY_DN2196_c1_g1_i1:75-1457(+)